MPTHASQAVAETLPPKARTGSAAPRSSWFARLLRALMLRKNGKAAIDGDPLLAFASEQPAEADTPMPAAAPLPKPKSRAMLWAALACGVIGIAAAAVLALPQIALLRASAVEGQPARLTIVTRPEGANVSIDGQPRGMTPLALSIAAGAHTVTLRSGASERVLPMTIAAGADVVRDVDMSNEASASISGALSIATDPPGAHVTIDGAPAGTSPVTVENLTAEPHTVVVTSAAGTAERTVSVAAGHTAMVVFSLPKVAGPVGGWLSVSAPFDVQVIEKDEVIGAGGAAKIMLAAGRHDVVLANRALDYQESRHIEIAGGSTTTIRVDPPKAALSVNARPWADVAIDGADIGQTPIANASAPIGTHQLVFRHPQYGERKQSVVVTARGPNRIAIDLTK